MQIHSVDIISDDVAELVQQSQQYQAGLYPAESIYQEDAQALLATNIYFTGAYQGQVLMGIGAVKKIETPRPYGEIKNLFVDPHHRGQGVSRVIMQALEQYLIDAGIGLCRLETGVNQPESINLYESLGYKRCEPYGDYQADPLSIFMQKELGKYTPSPSGRGQG
jgi:putative acetyltransferase